MLFALVGNVRTRPSPGLTGICPACGAAVIAKCGTQRLHHWAHYGDRICDSWKEHETPWHLNWKGQYPEHWQEVSRFDPVGEKHIADVHTEHGLTLEFQHSYLSPDECAARERFHGNMVWVVDGSRLARDLTRFLKGLSSLRPIWRKGLYFTPFPDELLPRNWLNSTVPVLFDFQNAIKRTEDTRRENLPLWGLLPRRVLDQAVILQLSRDAFVRWTHSKPHPIPTQAILENIALCFRAEQQQRARMTSLRNAPILLPQHQRWRRQTFIRF